MNSNAMGNKGFLASAGIQQHVERYETLEAALTGFLDEIDSALRQYFCINISDDQSKMAAFQALENKFVNFFKLSTPLDNDHQRILRGIVEYSFMVKKAENSRSEKSKNHQWLGRGAYNLMENQRREKMVTELQELAQQFIDGKIADVSHYLTARHQGETTWKNVLWRKAQAAEALPVAVVSKVVVVNEEVRNLIGTQANAGEAQENVGLKPQVVIDMDEHGDNTKDQVSTDSVPQDVSGETRRSTGNTWLDDMMQRTQRNSPLRIFFELIAALSTVPADHPLRPAIDKFLREMEEKRLVLPNRKGVRRNQEVDQEEVFRDFIADLCLRSDIPPNILPLIHNINALQTAASEHVPSVDTNSLQEEITRATETMNRLKPQLTESLQQLNQLRGEIDRIQASHTADIATIILGRWKIQKVLGDMEEAQSAVAAAKKELQNILDETKAGNASEAGKVLDEAKELLQLAQQSIEEIAAATTLREVVTTIEGLELPPGEEPGTSNGQQSIDLAQINAAIDRYRSAATRMNGMNHAIQAYEGNVAKIECEMQVIEARITAIQLELARAQNAQSRQEQSRALLTWAETSINDILQALGSGNMPPVSVGILAAVGNQLHQNAGGTESPDSLLTLLTAIEQRLVVTSGETRANAMRILKTVLNLLPEHA